MTPSCYRDPLRVVTAWSVARKLVAASLTRSDSGSKRFFYSSNSTSTKINTSAPLSISPGVIPQLDIPAPTPIALFIAISTLALTDDLFRQFIYV